MWKYESRFKKIQKLLPKIIQIQGPDHSSTKAIVLHEVTFPPDGSLVIKPNPLVSVGGVGTHSGWTGVILKTRIWCQNLYFMFKNLNNCPARLDVTTDLVVSEESLGPRGNSCSSSISGGSIESIVLGKDGGRYEENCLRRFLVKVCTLAFFRVKLWPYSGIPITSLDLGHPDSCQ